jgi:hypothetical protein
MELKQAVEVIKSNWPDERYTMLREALTVVLKYLPTSDNSDYAKCKKCNGFGKVFLGVYDEPLTMCPECGKHFA